MKNKIYCCDNMELMSSLNDCSVDLIYCDILYGTGRKFNDYQDLKPIRSVIEDHYIPRIKEMYRILKNTGSIYLQMDTKINHWVRCILDDVFGYNNFRNEIIWSYERMSLSVKKFVKTHENILFYTKSNNYLFNKQYQNYSGKSNHKGKRNIKTQEYLNTNRKKPLQSVWNISVINNKAKEKLGYDTQKPKALLERIIKASSNEGNLVADFYCGSGTSMIVAKELNRQYIGCDINQRAVDITNKRLNNYNPLF